MQVVKKNHLALIVFAVWSLVMVGCGSSTGSKMDNLNGTWQNPSNQKKVLINLASEQKTIIIDEKPLPVTIKSEEGDRYVLNVSDTASGAMELTLVRVWDDTGKAFTLKLEREGKSEILERVKG